LRADSAADIAHLAREAWYYLRTSIDPTWQFDDGPPSLPAARAYLIAMLRERTLAARTRARTPDEPAAVPGRADYLRRLRTELPCGAAQLLIHNV
jgi:hypothetical protein